MERSIIELVKSEADIVGNYNLLLKQADMYKILLEDAQEKNDIPDISYWAVEVVKKQQEIAATKKLLRDTRQYLSNILKGYEPEQ